MRGRWRAFIGIAVLQALAGSAPLPAQSRQDCLACHSDSSLSTEKNGVQRSLFVDEAVLNRSPHKKFACIACHSGFQPDNIPHKDPIGHVNCLKCHTEAPLKHTFHPQLAEALSAHRDPDVSCKDCHGTHDVVSPRVAGSKFHPSNLTAACGECHGDEAERFAASAHGTAAAAGTAGSPNCLTCHRSSIAGTGAAGDTLARKRTETALCLSCHLDNPEVRSKTAPTAGFIAAYEKSVHGAALHAGNAKAATCADCHGSHDMAKGTQASSLVNNLNIPSTCGKCHAEIAVEFGKSVHGTALARGNSDAPSCTKCHGEHNIYLHTDPRSSVAAANVSTQCSSCHSSVRLSEKYGIAGNRTQTYSDTYHGLAVRGGSVDAANCASCHSAHNIRPSSDPASTVNKANLAATCGKCHPGANQRFGVGMVHVEAEARAEEPVLYWIARTYIVLIFAVVGGMLLHNAFDFFRKSKRKLMVRRGLLSHETHGHSLYLRMTLSERLQHGALLVSFLTLVVTGFMLRFPETWWVQAVRRLSDHVFEARSVIHRAAAVLMVAAGIAHCAYVFGTARGRALIRDLLPGLQDVRDAVGVMKYNLGLSAEKPAFGRFSYIEKSEYWALVWGTIVMAATGAIMWFDNTFIGVVTKLGYDISRQVHYYEAWLATLAIVVWHFYFVIFNPDVYPINLAFWSGTITEEEMADEHPLELDEIKRSELAGSMQAVEPPRESPAEDTLPALKRTQAGRPE